MNTSEQPTEGKVEIVQDAVPVASEQPPTDAEKVIKDALEMGNYSSDGKEYIKFDAEKLGAVIAQEMAGVPAKYIAKALEKVRLEQMDKNAESKTSTPLSSSDERLYIVEGNFLRQAVEEAPSVMELVDLVNSSIAFSRQPVSIGGKSYRYADAIQDAARSSIDLEDLPNDFGIQDKLRSLGIKSQRTIN